jgi:hypothetical protein
MKNSERIAKAITELIEIQGDILSSGTGWQDEQFSANNIGRALNSLSNAELQAIRLEAAIRKLNQGGLPCTPTTDATVKP